MKYDFYSINIYNEDEDPTHKKDLFDYSESDITLEKFLITYDISSTPTVEIEIDSAAANEFANIKNLYIKITLGMNELVKDYNIGIIDFMYKPPNRIILYGFLCNYNDFSIIESSYLGDSFLSCVQGLGVKQFVNINGKGGYDKTFDDDFPMQYWRIQESKIQCLDKLLKLAYKNSIYTMSNNTIFINTIDYSNDSYNYETVAPEEVLYISKSNKINGHIRNLNSTSVLNTNIEKADMSLNTSMGKFYINRASDTGMINFTSSLPLVKYLGDTLIKFRYKDYLGDFIVGNSMKKFNSIVQTNSNWFVIQKIEKYSIASGAEMAVLFSAKGDEAE